MNGRYLMSGLVIFTLFFGGALYYFQNYAYYENVGGGENKKMLSEMSLVDVTGGTDKIAINDAKAIDATTSPLKFRACFTIDMSIPLMTETYEIYETPTPLTAPAWFDCYDAGIIETSLKTGEMIAFLSQKNIYEGVDRVIAVGDDGQAVAWHQFNEKYAE